MKKVILVLISLFISTSGWAAEKPNIIFILIDDLGKEWLSCYGGENIETPNIDKLALTGTKYNNAYSMPQCTPSRVCLLTGQYPYQNGWVNHWDAPRWGGGYFDWTQNPSIGRTMKLAGYATAAAGKWQLNDFRIQPDAMVKHGFDDYCMWTGHEGSKDKKHSKMSEMRYWDPYIHTKEGSKVYEGEFGPDIYNTFVLDFISQHKDQPFFVYYAMALTHSPMTSTPLEPDVKDNLDCHKAMIRYTDYLLEKIVSHVDNLGIRKNTIIVWTTDNGTSKRFSNGMRGRTVRGGKMKTTENGVNAPFIVNCPGLIPENKVSDALVDFTDMLPTFADLAGSKVEAKYKVDGYSLKDVFLGNKEKSEREWILAMGSKPAKMTDKGVENVFYFRDRVIRDARFKLFVGKNRQPIKLIDLTKDVEEENNLMKNPEYSDVLKRLSAVIETFPLQDHDPVYSDLPANEWDLKGSIPSQVHKTGHPEHKDVDSGKKKKKGKKKNSSKKNKKV